MIEYSEILILMCSDFEKQSIIYVAAYVFTDFWQIKMYIYIYISHECIAIFGRIRNYFIINMSDLWQNKNTCIYIIIIYISKCVNTDIWQNKKLFYNKCVRSLTEQEYIYIYAYISNPSYDIIARPQQKTALIYYPGNIHIDQSWIYMVFTLTFYRERWLFYRTTNTLVCYRIYK